MPPARRPGVSGLAQQLDKDGLSRVVALEANETADLPDEVRSALARALEDGDVHFLIFNPGRVQPRRDCPEYPEIFEALRLADLKCRSRGGRLILVGDPEAWGDFNFPVLGSEEGAMLAVRLRETLQRRPQSGIAGALEAFLIQAGTTFFLKGSRAALANIERSPEWLEVFSFGLRQINALPRSIRPGPDDARLIMNALTELTLLHPKFAVHFVREFRELYERIRPGIFMEIARSSDHPN